MEDVSSPEGFLGDALENLADPGFRRFSPIDQAPARLRIGGDGGEGLIHLVGDAGGHLPHGAHPGEMREALPHLLFLLSQELPTPHPLRGTPQPLGHGVEEALVIGGGDPGDLRLRFRRVAQLDLAGPFPVNEDLRSHANGIRVEGRGFVFQPGKGDPGRGLPTVAPGPGKDADGFLEDRRKTPRRSLHRPGDLEEAVQLPDPGFQFPGGVPQVLLGELPLRHVQEGREEARRLTGTLRSPHHPDGYDLSVPVGEADPEPLLDQQPIRGSPPPPLQEVLPGFRFQDFQPAVPQGVLRSQSQHFGALGVQGHASPVGIRLEDPHREEVHVWRAGHGRRAHDPKPSPSRPRVRGRVQLPRSDVRPFLARPEGESGDGGKRICGMR